MFPLFVLNCPATLVPFLYLYRLSPSKTGRFLSNLYFLNLVLFCEFSIKQSQSKSKKDRSLKQLSFQKQTRREVPCNISFTTLKPAAARLNTACSSDLMHHRFGKVHFLFAFSHLCHYNDWLKNKFGILVSETRGTQKNPKTKTK